MVLLQQSLINENSFCETKDRSRATHFMNPENGHVEELTANALEHTGNKPTENEEAPLPLPVMNFDKDKPAENSFEHSDRTEFEVGDCEVLPLPQMNFRKQSFAGLADGGKGNEDVLPLPKMF
jgi:hypothetical protein